MFLSTGRPISAAFVLNFSSGLIWLRTSSSRLRRQKLPILQSLPDSRRKLSALSRSGGVRASRKCGDPPSHCHRLGTPLRYCDHGRHATKVRGLEAYGIDPAAFGRQVQKRFACSTAAQPAPVRTSPRYFFLCATRRAVVCCGNPIPAVGLVANVCAFDVVAFA